MTASIVCLPMKGMMSIELCSLDIAPSWQWSKTIDHEVVECIERSSLHSDHFMVNGLRPLAMTVALQGQGHRRGPKSLIMRSMIKDLVWGPIPTARNVPRHSNKSRSLARYRG